MPTTVLTEGDTQPEISGRHDDAARQRDVASGEVPDRTHEAPTSAAPHVTTIALVSGDRTVRTRHTELTLEQIAEALPGTAAIMESIGVSWWKCAHAARGGNWALASYFALKTRSLLRGLAVTRPKYRDDISAFETIETAAVIAACNARDRDAFDRSFARAVDRANELHTKWDKAYIRWVLSPDPPKDLDLAP